MKWQSASSILIMALTMFDSYALMRFPIIRTLVRPLKAQATTFNIHEFLMNSTIPREESLTILQYIHNQDLLLKEKDLAINNKDLEMKDKDLQHVIVLKDKDLEISVVHERLTSVNRELLMSRGACTARGIFEYYLKSVHQEMMIKGSFNAKKVCTLIGKTSIYPCS
jgi:hypothetical protein